MAAQSAATAPLVAPLVTPVPQRTHRIAGLAAGLYLIASLVWLCGGAVSTTQPRTGVTFQGNFLGGAILYIISAAFFFLASCVALIGVGGEHGRLTSGERGRVGVYGVRRTGVAAAVIAVLASITLLVGAALWIGGLNSGGYTLIAGGTLGNTGASSAGGILFLIAFSLYFVSLSDAATSHDAAAVFVTSAASRAAAPASDDAAAAAAAAASLENSAAAAAAAIATSRAAALVSAGWALGIVASAAYTVLEGPGFLLLGSLLYIVSGTLLALGFVCEIFALTRAPAAAAAAPVAAGATAPARPEKPVQTTGESKETEAAPAAAAIAASSQGNGASNMTAADASTTLAVGVGA